MNDVLNESLNDKKSYFCLHCQTPQLYTLNTKNITLTIRGIPFTYEALQSLCIECGKRMYVPKINDINVDRRLEAMKKTENDMKLKK